jgi:hypothetical protein
MPSPAAEQPAEVTSGEASDEQAIQELERMVQMAQPGAVDLNHLPLAMYSAAHKDDRTTIAIQAGTNICGPELKRFKDAFSTSAYPDLPPSDRMYPPGTMEDMQLEVLRRNNMSMPCKKNQRVYGTVYAVDKKRAWVDVGHSSLAVLGVQVRNSALRNTKW